MSATVAVPLTITPEAAAHLHGLGLEPVHSRIVEYIRQTAPDLLGIETYWDYDRDAPVPDRVVVQAVQPAPDKIDLHWENTMSRWFNESYPPAITLHFVLTTRFEAPHGR